MLKIDLKSFDNLFNKINSWAKNLDVKDLADASEALVNDYKTKMRSGKDGANNQMAPVKDSTMSMPIRMGGPDKRIRREVSSSRNPFNVTGETINSIKKNKKGNAYEIGATGEHGVNVLEWNVKPKSNKVARDPLIVSDIQLDIVVDGIIKTLDKALQ